VEEMLCFLNVVDDAAPSNESTTSFVVVAFPFDDSFSSLVWMRFAMGVGFYQRKTHSPYCVSEFCIQRFPFLSKRKVWKRYRCMASSCASILLLRNGFNSPNICSSWK
jgi:hypothetical protein